MSSTDTEWRATGDPADEAGEGYIAEYDISAVPNDFNLTSIVSFIDSGSIAIPGFQRNYVWDLSRASKLIESLLLGLPVPQIFLYQKDKGPLYVIDGQQRLMTIYYFVHGRFPKRDARAKLRELFDEHGSIPESVLADDSLFADFKLQLKSVDDDVDRRSPFHGKKYATLEDDLDTFRLRTVRNVVVKQIRPTDDHSSMFEVFNRLNSGGINLTAQELRACLYESQFQSLLLRLNRRPRWRALVLREEPDARFRDVEILLRSFALLLWTSEYRPSMTRFLNRFSAHARSFGSEELTRLESLFDDFLAATAGVRPHAFAVQETTRFNVVLFETVFAEALRERSRDAAAHIPPLSDEVISRLDADPDFRSALKEGTTKPEKVRTRLERARSILSGR